MLETQQEEQGFMKFRDFWDSPITKIAIAFIAIVAAIAKVVEFLVHPDMPSIARYSIWVVLLITASPLIIQIIVEGINRLIENALERQMLQGELPIVVSKEITGEVAYVFNSKSYGMSYENLIVHCTIHEDGSAVFRREIDLKALLPIRELQHYILFPEASLGREVPELIEITPLVPFKKLTPTVTALSSGRMSLTVSISPPLSAGDHIRYQVEERSPPSLYAVTGLEERKAEYDYFAWDISRPTKQLEISVFFPEDVQPVDSELDVWYAVGQSRSRHDPEYKRVRDYLHGKQEDVHYILAATIPYPVLGLSYVIKWTPPKPK